jgi:hypothetical protein
MQADPIFRLEVGEKAPEVKKKEGAKLSLMHSIQERGKDDYEWSRLLRQKLRTNKKHDKEVIRPHFHLPRFQNVQNYTLLSLPLFPSSAFFL